MKEISKPLELTNYISNSMTVMVKLGVQIYILALFLVNTNSAKTPITCTAGDFPIGGNASVTCNFGPEIDLNKKSYAVKHYPFQGDKTQGKDVLNCNMNKQCILGPIKGIGVTYPPREPSIVVVMFDATEEVEGTYLCQMLPPTEHETECNLTVHAPRFTSTTVEPVDKGTANTGVIVPVATVLCIGFIVFVIVCVWRCRHGQSLPGGQSASQPPAQNISNNTGRGHGQSLPGGQSASQPPTHNISNDTGQGHGQSLPGEQSTRQPSLQNNTNVLRECDSNNVDGTLAEKGLPIQDAGTGVVERPISIHKRTRNRAGSSGTLRNVPERDQEDCTNGRLYMYISQVYKEFSC